MGLIHDALKEGHMRTVRRMIRKDPALLKARNASWLQFGDGQHLDHLVRGSTPLMIASAGGHTGMVEWLLNQGADINAVDDAGRTSIYYASWNGKDRAVALLMERGADINRAIMIDDRFTALMVATDYGNIACVRQLIKHPAIDVDARDTEGRTVLFYSCLKAKVEITRLLLEMGGDPTVADYQGKTPVGVARRMGHRGCLRLLEVRNRRDLTDVLHPILSIYSSVSIYTYISSIITPLSVDNTDCLS